MLTPLPARVLTCLSAALTLLPICSAAFAADRMISIVNQSGEVIQAITLKTITASTLEPTATLVNPINSGDTGDLTLLLEDGNCVAEVTFQLGNGNTKVQNDIDLCSVDGIVVE